VSGRKAYGMRAPFVRFGTDYSPTAWWEWFFAPIVWPLFIVLLFVAAGLSIPYFWLYPERHAHQFDFEGSPEEQRQLREYRNHRRRISIWRRLLEKARVVPFDAGPSGHAV
jgi:hypothetical protein